MSKPKLVVLGMMTRIPVPGVIWQTMHYVLGFQRLGYDVWYVEDHGMTPRVFFDQEADDGWKRAAGFVDKVMRRFDMADRWAYNPRYSDSRPFGLGHQERTRLFDDAEVIINLHGATRPQEEHARGGRLVFVETDPVELQVQLHEGSQEAADYIAPHVALFSFGENYGSPSSRLPVVRGLDFRPTRQPVLLDLWRDRPAAPISAFTTIGNWRQGHRVVSLDGESYQWSKDLEFERVIDLPARTGAPFELALSSCEPADAARLRRAGWRVRAPFLGLPDLDAYRDYIAGSHGEFTVAKDQNVRLRSGWFSDRSATYLAAGRPVVTQETGFSDNLPTGCGLMSFTDVEEAAAAIEAVTRDPRCHANAASDIAHEFFAAEKVLGSLLDRTGFDRPRLTARGATARDTIHLPHNLVLEPTSRWPLQLPLGTVTALAAIRRQAEAAGTVPDVSDSNAVTDTGTETQQPQISVVIPVHNQVNMTVLCLESLLRTPTHIEVLVIDNASTDETPRYLRAAARRDPRVRVLTQAKNLGFAAACNAGVQASRARTVVFLNNDTVVPLGALERLTGYLEDAAIGLVGPVTNRSCNEAQIMTDYRTLGDLTRFADEHTTAQSGRSFDIRMLAMFCVAFRRDLFDRVGPLDESFGLGMFEDDDYAIRVTRAGYRVVCAEDVFVHHFGQASVGALANDGAYQRLFDENKARLEAKWGIEWQPHARRQTADYVELRARIRDTLASIVPSGQTVAVVSKGDDELIDIDGCVGWHFPRNPDGTLAVDYPADSADAVERVLAAQHGGAAYLAIPAPSSWWLRSYDGLREHLEAHAQQVHGDDDVIVYRLGRHDTERASHDGGLSAAIARIGQQLDHITDRLDAQDERLAGLALAGSEQLARTRTLAQDLRLDIDELWQATPIDTRDAGTDKSVYRVLRARLRAFLHRHLANDDAVVLVVSRGDDELLRTPRGSAWHFPRLPDGSWSGTYPETDKAAVAQVEAQRRLGADHLLVPSTSQWWLDHYQGLADYLRRNASLLADEPALGSLWHLTGGDIRDGGDALVECIQRCRAMQRDRMPTVLNWTGAPIAAPATVQLFEPPYECDRLPYLDATVDIVVVGGDGAERAAEARRVASAAVVVKNAAGYDVEWQVTASGRPRLDVVMVSETGRPTATAARRMTHGGEHELRVLSARGWTSLSELTDSDVLPDMAEALTEARSSTADVLIVVDAQAIPIGTWASDLLETFDVHAGALAVSGLFADVDGTPERDELRHVHSDHRSRVPLLALRGSAARLVPSASSWRELLAGLDSVLETMNNERLVHPEVIAMQWPVTAAAPVVTA